MSNEITVRASITIRSGNLTYQSPIGAFTADMAGNSGPFSGAVLCSVHGQDIDLSGLPAKGGVCWLQNQDDTNYVEVGIRDTITNVFYPMMQILPGEFYPLRLSPNIEQEEVGTGTGPASGTTALHIKANTDSCYVLVDAFPP